MEKEKLLCRKKDTLVDAASERKREKRTTDAIEQRCA